MFNALVVILCKPVIHKLKILGGGEVEFYKSMGEPQKGGREPNFKNSVGGNKKKGGLFLTQI